MEFKEFFDQNQGFSEVEIAALYQGGGKIRDISKLTGKSIGEVYRIIHRFGQPNRTSHGHHNVVYFADSGFPVSKIAEFTKYTPRNVRYIISKYNKK